MNSQSFEFCAKYTQNRFKEICILAMLLPCFHPPLTFSLSLSFSCCMALPCFRQKSTENNSNSLTGYSAVLVLHGIYIVALISVITHQPLKSSSPFPFHITVAVAVVVLLIPSFSGLFSPRWCQRKCVCVRARAK